MRWGGEGVGLGPSRKTGLCKVLRFSVRGGEWGFTPRVNNKKQPFEAPTQPKQNDPQTHPRVATQTLTPPTSHSKFLNNFVRAHTFEQTPTPTHSNTHSHTHTHEARQTHMGNYYQAGRATHKRTHTHPYIHNYTYIEIYSALR